jgi:hypothetical protein
VREAFAAKLTQPVVETGVFIRQNPDRYRFSLSICSRLALSAMNDSPTKGAERRSGQRILYWLACLALVIVMVWLGLNESGRSAWDNYRRQGEAKGERFDFVSFIPKPVPDDQNFALAPIVASCYAEILDAHGHRVIPPNTNVVDRLELERYSDYSLVKTPTNGLGSWTQGMTADLQVWQNYYRALSAKTNLFPVPPQPQSPAADVLLALSRYDSVIEELHVAGRRPESRFPLNYDADPPTLILLPHLGPLKQSSQVLQLRAIAELQNGQPQQALDDVRLILRLTESIRTEPFLISHLVRIAMVQIALQPIWEGLAGRQWSDAQLAELNQALARLDFPADYEFSLRGERALSIAAIEHLRRKRDFDRMINADDTAGSDQGQGSFFLGHMAFQLVPGSVFYRNELAIARMQQQYLLPIVDVKQRTASPEASRRAGEAIEEMRAHWSPNNVLACMLLPALEKMANKYAYAQSSVDMARMACALERYRLAHNEFPESLEALSPSFLRKVPHDLINGQPLHYRRTSGGKFLLYSVGWNETDDGGTVVLNKTGRLVDTTKGDWVWPGTISGSQ